MTCVAAFDAFVRELRAIWSAETDEERRMRAYGPTQIRFALS
jgi:hypothetical protein